MNSEDSLNKMSLDILTGLFSDATNELLESKISNKDPEETERYQKLVELIQKVMVAKNGSDHPLK